MSLPPAEIPPGATWSNAFLRSFQLRMIAINCPIGHPGILGGKGEPAGLQFQLEPIQGNQEGEGSPGGSQEGSQLHTSPLEIALLHQPEGGDIVEVE